MTPIPECRDAACRVFPGSALDVASHVSTEQASAQIRKPLLRQRLSYEAFLRNSQHRTPGYEVLRNFHEDDHEREQYQRLDEGQAQNQGQLKVRTRRRIAGHRLASRRSYLALALRRQPRRDCNGEAGGDRNPVCASVSRIAGLRERRNSENRKHHHHEQHHQHLPHCFLLMKLPPVGG